MSAAALGVNAALANGIGHAVNCQHVSRNAVVDAVSFRITDNVFESGPHDVLELLVNHRLLPEVALSVLHPLEVGSGHAAGIAQNVGNYEYSLVCQNVIGGCGGGAVGTLSKNFAFHLIGITAGDLILGSGGDQDFAIGGQQFRSIVALRAGEAI